MNSFNRQRYLGITLLEILLVMVIGSGILYLSVRQYQSFRSDADVQQLQYNVDQLFQALAQYYQANCYGQTGPNGVLQPGTLHPSQNPPSPFPIDIASQLQTPGFLTVSFPTSPIVDQSTGPVAGASINGYVTQFNQSALQSRTACLTSGCASSVTINTYIIWKAQVAVLLKDIDTKQQYLQLLKGDCLSTLNGKIVEPCNANQPGDYVVWERLPSFATPTSSSDYWITNPTSKQFKQMYTTYPRSYLMTTKGQIPGPGGAGSQAQYFLCGS